MNLSCEAFPSSFSFQASLNPGFCIHRSKPSPNLSNLQRFKFSNHCIIPTPQSHCSNPAFFAAIEIVRARLSLERYYRSNKDIIAVVLLSLPEQHCRPIGSSLPGHHCSIGFIFARKSSHRSGNRCSNCTSLSRTSSTQSIHH